MTGQLSWRRDGDCLSIHGELDQDVLVPLWDARAQATQGATTISLAGVTRVDTAGLALLIHFIDLIRKQGSVARVNGKSDNLLTLVQLYNLPTEMIP